MKVALLFILVSISDLSHALYGGKPMGDNSTFTSIVSLHFNDPENPHIDSFCSGVLVAPNKVLTTGHCVEVISSEVIGRWNAFQSEPELFKVKAVGVKYDVADITIAPSYTEAFGFEGEDLALITLKRPLSLAPIKILPRSQLKAGLLVTMIAKGMQADSFISSVKDFVGHTVVFTDGKKSGICEGDSGGALLVKVNNDFMLAGILSAQSEGCEKQTGVSVFPRILR